MATPIASPAGSLRPNGNCAKGVRARIAQHAENSRTALKARSATLMRFVCAASKYQAGLRSAVSRSRRHSQLCNGCNIVGQHLIPVLQGVALPGRGVERLQRRGCWRAFGSIDSPIQRRHSVDDHGPDNRDDSEQINQTRLEPRMFGERFHWTERFLTRFDRQLKNLQASCMKPTSAPQSLCLTLRIHTVRHEK